MPDVADPLLGRRRRPHPARVLVVGAGAIGGVLAASLRAAGHTADVLTTNAAIGAAIREHGFRLVGTGALRHAPAAGVFAAPSDAAGPYDYVLIATQPPQVEDAARQALPLLADGGCMVCFQNGLCEVRVAAIAGPERVIGAIVAWGASMPEPGVYDRTSSGGLTFGRLSGPPDGRVEELARMLAPQFPVGLTGNLLGARWSKLAINCAISTLGTIGGDRLGRLIRRRFVRRLALEIMTETVHVARAEGVRLEKVAGTVDLDWLALDSADRARTASLGLAAKHGVLLATGLRYRRLRSSMLSAIERGRAPAVDFLNGEVIVRGREHGIPTPASAAARAEVWRIARGERRPSLAALTRLYEETRR